LSVICSVKHLLVYGPSGAGKTSLIECGLRNQFSDADWFAVSIRRGSNMTASVFARINEALHEKIALDPQTKLPRNPDFDFGEAIENLFAERYQPVYLLFDLFEELLIFGRRGRKKGLFHPAQSAHPLQSALPGAARDARGVHRAFVGVRAAVP
jgi:hypothetical protein